MIVLALFYFITGICIGSFSNVLIYRLPKDESINFPASNCQSCHTALKWYHNIPIFSWLFLGGKCAFCKDKISIQYPLVELAGGILMLIVFYKENPELDYVALFKTLMVGILFIVLLALSMIDFRYKGAPDLLLNTGVILSLLYSFSLDGIKNALIFATIFWILRFILSKIKKQEAMGLADIYIFGIIGAVLDLKLGFMAIFLGAILTLPAYAIIRKKDYELPFIPFLSAGLFIIYIFNTYALEILGWLYG
ncbi:peptidase A24 N-terminal domain-containing protein, putative prepilin signal peptidase [Campylobacter blaseri]|uniref:Prepilin peptidase n=1 Tax=Campylobacter blaseri TaxID=2042961 RepID=A0A2P8R2B0_9BACT|nr:A24 family peptidase [Campylobacter blaseri]PSM52645.1 prepilin peptidase [Campylobacter blaseri]PSM54293.1 prepilin peptidase [Campylobacter blaseri]QKF85944.1 peptidase A24 N-terminal domain-containing protein, putative prepilin signal peptidase [Campylobacter blaseri]